MTRERWEDLANTIRDKFKVLTDGREELEDRPGTREFLEFETPAGKFRLEFVESARVTGVATSGGRRVGTAGRIVKTFSDEETVVHLDTYRWADGDWQPIDSSTFA
jgi:hypothetical protein